MEKGSLILDELKTNTPILASLGQLDVYTVPNGYFEHLVTDITARISEAKLFSSSRANVLQTPEGYFETLSDTVLSKIKSEENQVFTELEEVAALLNTISKKNIYTVPSGYFEKLTFSIHQKEVAKIISFSTARRLISYAAAAVIAGILFTGGFLYEQHRKSLDVTNELNKVSDSELNTYLENDTVVLNEENNSMYQEASEVNQSLKIISDEDLQQYLKEVETVGEATN